MTNTVVLHVAGLSGSRSNHYKGPGKSFACSRFVYPTEDLAPSHPSSVSLAEFHGSVLCGEHSLYWGSRNVPAPFKKKIKAKDEHICVHVVEHSTFLEDVTLQPFSSKEKNYPTTVLAGTIKPGKRAYHASNCLHQSEISENSAAVCPSNIGSLPRGILLVVDCSRFDCPTEYFRRQMLEAERILTQRKSKMGHKVEVSLLLTKCDEIDETRLPEVAKLARTFKLDVFQTSAEKNVNLFESFACLASRVLKLSVSDSSVLKQAESFDKGMQVMQRNVELHRNILAAYLAKRVLDLRMTYPTFEEEEVFKDAKCFLGSKETETFFLKYLISMKIAELNSCDDLSEEALTRFIHSHPSLCGRAEELAKFTRKSLRAENKARMMNMTVSSPSQSCLGSFMPLEGDSGFDTDTSSRVLRRKNSKNCVVDQSSSEDEDCQSAKKTHGHNSEHPKQPRGPFTPPLRQPKITKTKSMERSVDQLCNSSPTVGSPSCTKSVTLPRRSIPETPASASAKRSFWGENTSVSSEETVSKKAPMPSQLSATPSIPSHTDDDEVMVRFENAFDILKGKSSQFVFPEGTDSTGTGRDVKGSPTFLVTPSPTRIPSPIAPAKEARVEQGCQSYSISVRRQNSSNSSEFDSASNSPNLFQPTQRKPKPVPIPTIPDAARSSLSASEQYTDSFDKEEEEQVDGVFVPSIVSPNEPEQNLQDTSPAVARKPKPASPVAPVKPKRSFKVIQPTAYPQGPSPSPVTGKQTGSSPQSVSKGTTSVGAKGPPVKPKPSVGQSQPKPQEKPQQSPPKPQEIPQQSPSASPKGGSPPSSEESSPVIPPRRYSDPDDPTPIVPCRNYDIESPSPSQSAGSSATGTPVLDRRQDPFRDVDLNLEPEQVSVPPRGYTREDVYPTGGGPKEPASPPDCSRGTRGTISHRPPMPLPPAGPGAETQPLSPGSTALPPPPRVTVSRAGAVPGKASTKYRNMPLPLSPLNLIEGNTATPPESAVYSEPFEILPPSVKEAKAHRAAASAGFRPITPVREGVSQRIPPSSHRPSAGVPVKQPSDPAGVRPNANPPLFSHRETVEGKTSLVRKPLTPAPPPPTHALPPRRQPDRPLPPYDLPSSWTSSPPQPSPTRSSFVQPVIASQRPLPNQMPYSAPYGNVPDGQYPPYPRADQLSLQRAPMMYDQAVNGFDPWSGGYPGARYRPNSTEPGRSPPSSAPGRSLPSRQLPRGSESRYDNSSDDAYEPMCPLNVLVRFGSRGGRQTEIKVQQQPQPSPTHIARGRSDTDGSCDSSGYVKVVEPFTKALPQVWDGYVPMSPEAQREFEQMRRRGTVPLPARNPPPAPAQPVSKTHHMPVYWNIVSALDLETTEYYNVRHRRKPRRSMQQLGIDVPPPRPPKPKAPKPVFEPEDEDIPEWELPPLLPPPHRDLPPTPRGQFPLTPSVPPTGRAQPQPTAPALPPKQSAVHHNLDARVRHVPPPQLAASGAGTSCGSHAYNPPHPALGNSLDRGRRETWEANLPPSAAGSLPSASHQRHPPPPPPAAVGLGGAALGGLGRRRQFLSESGPSGSTAALPLPPRNLHRRGLYTVPAVGTI